MTKGPEFSTNSRYHAAHEFFKKLLKWDEFPPDYAGFIKRLLKLMQGIDYAPISKIECEMTPVEKPMAVPPAQLQCKFFFIEIVKFQKKFQLLRINCAYL